MYCYTVRLACLNHAASVQAEPGSNSSIEFRDAAPILTPRAAAPDVRPGLRSETDSFTGGLISKRVRPSLRPVKTNGDRFCFPPPGPARNPKVGQASSAYECYPIRSDHLMQGSNAFNWLSLIQKGMISDDHFFCV